jgi:phage-related protein
MPWHIEYPYDDVAQFILQLSPGLAAKYLRLTDLMLEFGADLGMPHTRALSHGLFELRLKAPEGIARIFYCTLAGQRIAMLYGYIKKSQKTAPQVLKIARKRLLEVKNDESR